MASNWLKTLGSDITGLFKWMQTPQGQAVIGLGETAVEAAVPASVAVINLANLWIAKIIQNQAFATAAGQGDGSGATKASLVLSEITPLAFETAAVHKLLALTPEHLRVAHDHFVAALSALGADADDLFKLHFIPQALPLKTEEPSKEGEQSQGEGQN